MAVTKARIRALLRRKFLVEENRHILEEIKEKELDAILARAAREAAEVRAEMADQLAAANRRLAVANQELEQFAYSAAHDLQEPLRKIRIFGQLLQTKVKGKVDAEVDQFLGFCMQGAAQMDQLIQDLLLYAGATKSDDTPQHPVDLQSALAKALQHLEVTIADADAQVTAGPLPQPVRTGDSYPAALAESHRQRHQISPSQYPAGDQDRRRKEGRLLDTIRRTTASGSAGILAEGV